MITVEECIDYKIKELLSQINDKKVIIFGAGKKTEKFLKICDISERIAFFLDNDSKLWNKELYGKKIFSPNKLKLIDQQNIVILIVSPYIQQIRAQLEDLNVKCDIIDAIELLFLHNQMVQHVSFFNKFMNYLKKIDKFVIDDKKHSDEKIGIVIVPAFYQAPCYYSIMVMLLLIKRGYEVQLIVDDNVGVEDYVVCSGYTDVCCTLVQSVIEYINNNIVEIEVKKISEINGNKQELNDNEIKQIEKCALVSTTWHKSIKNFRTRFTDKKIIFEVFKDILINNYKVIKIFFEENMFSVLNVYTGIYNDWGLYKIISLNNKNISLMSFDSNGKGKITFSRGIVGELTEIKTVLEEYDMQSEIFNELEIIGREIFEKSVNGAEKNSYQIIKAGQDDFERNVDIILPLNIEWDAAAYALDSPFLSMEEWLIETLDFIIKNTDATVMVREHPVKRLFEHDFDFIDYDKLLEDNFGKNDRIVFVSASDRINTYKQIQKCKLVLPFTSTVGIESALLEKLVVLCTDVYYKSGIRDGYCNSKIKYFEKIKYALTNANKYAQAVNKKKLYIALALHSYMNKEDVFHECSMEWTKLNLEELDSLELVDYIVDVIAHGKLFILQNYLSSSDRREKYVK